MLTLGLAQLAGNDAIHQAESAAQALLIDPENLGPLVAKAAAKATPEVAGDAVTVDTLVVTRQGDVVGAWEPS